MHITEVNEILDKVAKGELTTEDAQKILGTYKDEEVISYKCWDEHGNECECNEAAWWEGCK